MFIFMLKKKNEMGGRKEEKNASFWVLDRRLVEKREPW
jgi:hypothetical protein